MVGIPKLEFLDVKRFSWRNVWTDPYTNALLDFLVLLTLIDFFMKITWFIVLGFCSCMFIIQILTGRYNTKKNVGDVV